MSNSYARDSFSYGFGFAPPAPATSESRALMRWQLCWTRLSFCRAPTCALASMRLLA
jgi:hypothetical protein